MLPEHGHIHVSTPFLFFGGLLLVALLGTVFAFLYTRKKNQREFELEKLRIQNDALLLDRSVSSRHSSLGLDRGNSTFASCTSTVGYVPTAPSTATPVVVQQPGPAVVHTGGSDGLLTGVLLGSVISNHGGHETYVERDIVRETHTSTYDPAPSYDSGSDSGFSYDSGSSSLSSSDSGGFDIDW